MKLQDKIKHLRNKTVANGCTEAEEKAAQELADKLEARQAKQSSPYAVTFKVGKVKVGNAVFKGSMIVDDYNMDDLIDALTKPFGYYTPEEIAKRAKQNKENK